MNSANASAEALRKQIAKAETELKKLKDKLAKFEARDISGPLAKLSIAELQTKDIVAQRRWPLSQEEYRRYGRQMIVPNTGIEGQLKLKNASVLVVGAGGLGCPAAAYLAGAGIGTLGIVDGDLVEISNLHRQILHSTATVGMKKVHSAVEYLKSLNPNVMYKPYDEHLTPQDAAAIVSQYDLVLDCTDHPTSRYLISDVCILLQKPLVSASALRTDGQLIVLNSPPLQAGELSGGPCYRCVFPKPPPVESVVSCGDGGILGPVVGVMGVLQALEAIRLVTEGKLTHLASLEEAPKPNPASMLLFSASSGPSFRTVKLRSRRAGCFACSSEGILTLESLSSGSLDYMLFCGITTPINILSPEERIQAKCLKKLMDDKEKQYLLVDVREKVQFDICNLEGSINVPFSTLRSARSVKETRKIHWIPEAFPSDTPIYVVCRLGNDSQIVVKDLKEAGLDKNGQRYIGDIKDGLKSWREQVDNSWPEY